MYVGCVRVTECRLCSQSCFTNQLALVSRSYKSNTMIYKSLVTRLVTSWNRPQVLWLHDSEPCSIPALHAYTKWNCLRGFYALFLLNSPCCIQIVNAERSCESVNTQLLSLFDCLYTSLSITACASQPPPPQHPNPENKNENDKTNVLFNIHQHIWQRLHFINLKKRKQPSYSSMWWLNIYIITEKWLEF